MKARHWVASAAQIAVSMVGVVTISVSAIGPSRQSVLPEKSDPVTGILLPVVYVITTSSDYHVASCPLRSRFENRAVYLNDVGTRGPCSLCKAGEDEAVFAFLWESAGAKVSPITEAEARDFVATAKARAGDDATKFAGHFRSLLTKRNPQYSGVIELTSPRSIRMSVVGPIGMLEIQAFERVRKFEPMTSIQWMPGVMVLVQPQELSAPDIEKLVVERDYEGVIAPLSSTLKLAPLTTAMNVTRQLHTGSVLYPASAFAPKPRVGVTITAIPAAGQNIVNKLNAIHLLRLQ